MKNNILLEEEIKKFKKLTGILNEAGGTTAWVSEFLNLIKASTKRVPDVLLNSTEMKDLISSGKVTLTAAKGISKIDWTKLAVDEIMVLFKWDLMFITFKDLIKKHKIDMSDAAIDTYKGSFKKIAQAYNKVDKNPWDTFVSGVKTTGAASLFTKRVVRLISPEFVQKSFPTYFQRLTKEEVKKMHGWFWLGVGDFNEISAIFKRHGFPHALTNLGGQYVKKWFFWSALFSVSNFVIGLVKDDDVIYESDLEWMGQRTLQSLEGAGLHWVVPFTVVWTEIISPVGKEGLRRIAGEKYKKSLEIIKTKAEKEKEAIEKLKQSADKDTTATPKKGSYNY